MYKYIIICLTICCVLSSCDEESTSPYGTAEVNLYSSMSNNTVTTPTNKGAVAQVGVDSLRVMNFRILISDLKLHGHNQDDENDESFKIGPFIIKADSSKFLYTVAQHSIPEGYYDKIKFEIHKFPESERKQYENDEDFGEFATQDKYTFLIDGYYYEGGNEIPFSFKSNMTENLSLIFDSEIELSSEYVNNLELEIDPSLLFVESGFILRPDSENQKEIEKNIHRAIKVLKSLNEDF